MGADLKSRFMRFVSTDGDCWNWTGSITADGYGRFWLDGCKKAHRVSYEIFAGAIPAGLEVDHICRNRRCVNPKHLRAATGRQNMANSSYADQTHCKHGHPLSGDNVYPNRSTRHCVTCARDRAARFKRKRRQEVAAL